MRYLITTILMFLSIHCSEYIFEDWYKDRISIDHDIPVIYDREESVYLYSYDSSSNQLQKTDATLTFNRIENYLSLTFNNSHIIIYEENIKNLKYALQERTSRSIISSLQSETLDDFTLNNKESIMTIGNKTIFGNSYIVLQLPALKSGYLEIKPLELYMDGKSIESILEVIESHPTHSHALASNNIER